MYAKKAFFKCSVIKKNAGRAMSTTKKFYLLNFGIIHLISHQNTLMLVDTGSYLNMIISCHYVYLVTKSVVV